MEYEIYLVVRVTQDMLEGTTLESIQETLNTTQRSQDI